ncbi:hypothetical protein FRC07_003676 [Ceratobasidium sp. 392]|nr:hypothetical protein FRC07_003676 [Ceratobasidium sp. 392]
MSLSEDIKPFSISVSDQQLDELATKLRLTRLPDELDLPAGQEWDWGIPLAVLKPVVDYWRTQYDWRAVEEKLNRTLPQFTTEIDTPSHGIQKIHFVHKRSDNPSAIPLIFVHGWPGNFLEVSKMIDDLANPKDPKHPSFHVVAPSSVSSVDILTMQSQLYPSRLPGFVFSQRANTPGMEAQTTALVFDKLMAKLGYEHYLAQGGIHQNYWFSGAPTFAQNPLISLKVMLGQYGLPGGYLKHEIEGIKAGREFAKAGSAYANIQETKPHASSTVLI